MLYVVVALIVLVVFGAGIYIGSRRRAPYVTPTESPAGVNCTILSDIELPAAQVGTEEVIPGGEKLTVSASKGDIGSAEPLHVAVKEGKNPATRAGCTTELDLDGVAHASMPAGQEHVGCVETANTAETTEDNARDDVSHVRSSADERVVGEPDDRIIWSDSKENSSASTEPNGQNGPPVRLKRMVRLNRDGSPAYISYAAESEESSSDRPRNPLSVFSDEEERYYDLPGNHPEPISRAESARLAMNRPRQRPLVVATTSRTHNSHRGGLDKFGENDSTGHLGTWRDDIDFPDDV